MRCRRDLVGRTVRDPFPPAFPWRCPAGTGRERAVRSVGFSGAACQDAQHRTEHRDAANQGPSPLTYGPGPREKAIVRVRSKIIGGLLMGALAAVLSVAGAGAANAANSSNAAQVTTMTVTPFAGIFHPIRNAGHSDLCLQ